VNLKVLLVSTCVKRMEAKLYISYEHESLLDSFMDDAVDE
jgi:hypothetical protein